MHVVHALGSQEIMHLGDGLIDIALGDRPPSYQILPFCLKIWLVNWPLSSKLCCPLALQKQSLNSFPFSDLELLLEDANHQGIQFKRFNKLKG
jgi:hypothetical protein